MYLKNKEHGKPCKKCGGTLRFNYPKSKGCVACAAEGKLKRKMKPGYVHEDPDKKRLRYYQYIYGISNEQYQALLDKQEGKCAICGEEKELKLHVDHDHTTKQVRGLLCGNCNTGIGLLQEKIEVLQRAIRYLTLT